MACMETKGFTEHRAAEIFKNMLLAVQSLHKRNIVHRDLKPENFCFDEDSDGIVQLIDFGCALNVDDEQAVTGICGTPSYIAPEVATPGFLRTGRVWKASDMWSLGVILFLVLVGRTPFRGSSQLRLVENIK